MADPLLIAGYRDAQTRGLRPPLTLASVLASRREEMKLLLRHFVRKASVSGSEGGFTSLCHLWAVAQGFEADLFETTEAAVAAYPEGRARHLPLAGRPTLVIRLPGAGGGRNLLFNAHSDVVSAPGEGRWRFGPWSGEEAEGRIYGRGACDVKGPLVSALWALLAIRAAVPEGLAGDVLIEIVPGEEDCVGLGTLTSVLKGYRADGVVVLEPTEALPRCASRGGCRFEITCRGRAVHGTIKWLGEDAIELQRHVLEALAELERKWDDRTADPLFAPYPIARPVTVDSVHAGEWQGMICDRSTCGGYLELLPGDEPEEWKRRFKNELKAAVARRVTEREADSVSSPAADRIDIRFTEDYSGHRTPIADPLCRSAQRVTESELGEGLTWAGFNSGCEAGLRAALFDSPTLVWGPGSLAQAHAVDEFVDFASVERVAAMFAALAIDWAVGPSTQ